MDKINNGWFSEINDLWPGQCFSLKVDEILSHEKSEFQDIMVVKTKHHGNALILDGIIQCTEFDEFTYQEMISFLPLCSHANPKKVLIVGGGDGGVAREVAKHPSVEQIVQVEIDQKVIDVSKIYLPSMAKGFESSKLDLQVCDGVKYVQEHPNEFDVIITDSSDPIGPATELFAETYFEALKKALKSDGIICSQAGNIWTDLKTIKISLDNFKKYFAKVKFAVVDTPTYPTGHIGFIVATTDENNDLKNPKLKFSDEALDEMNLRYYNSEIHSASFVLPNFAKKVLT